MTTPKHHRQDTPNAGGAQRRRRLRGGLLLALACAMLLAACAPPRPPARAVDPLVGFVGDLFHFIATTHQNPAPLHDASLSLAEAIDAGQSIKSALDRMAASDDPFGDEMASVICTGLGAIADPDAPEDGASTTTPESWHDFMVAELEKTALGTKPLKTIRAKVDLVTNTVELAQINPRLAYMYARECGSR